MAKVTLLKEDWEELVDILAKRGACIFPSQTCDIGQTCAECVEKVLRDMEGRGA